MTCEEARHEGSSAPPIRSDLAFSSLLLEMGKASRRKHAEQQQKLYFDIKGDARSAEDRANSREMLDKLQKKLDDDALREDGFYFLDGKYVDSRRPRFTPGMKTQSFVGHKLRITDVAVVPMRRLDSDTSPDQNSFVVTFGIDCIGVWNMKTGERLGQWETSKRSGVSVCGAASLGLPADQSDHLRIAMAITQQPQVGVFDVNRFEFLSDIKTNQAEATTSIGVGHHQQITSLAFSRCASLLATGSLDSTCVLWRVNIEDPSTPKLRLTTILPVADAGVARCVFTQDDTQLVSIGGDGIIKVWRVEPTTPDTLHAQREQWSSAEMLALSITHTKQTLSFDDVLPSFHANDEWTHFKHRGTLGRTENLEVPGEQDSKNAEGKDPASTEETGDEAKDHDSVRVEEDMKLNKQATPQPTGGDPEPISEVEKLRRVYEQIEHFDFERLLNPSSPLLEPGSNISSIQWPVVSPDAGGLLLQTYTTRTQNGAVARHTSRVSGCAVAKEADLMVSVSLDKSVICWSMSGGTVQFIVRDAHAAPILCCALTSPSTSSPSDLELLLATAGKDNLVKIWQFVTEGLACVYSLSGHYDAIMALQFDSSGVFLLSAGDDASVHCWRVRPAPPDAPPKPEVTMVDRFAITIKWLIPLANGSALTKYVIHTDQVSSLNGGADMKKVKDIEVACKYKTVTADNLQPGIQYQLRVAAVNGVGHSSWSEATDPVETLAFAPSRIDKAIQYSNVTPSTIRLRWKAPSANGATIRSYTVRARPENVVVVPLHEVIVPINELTVVTPEEAPSKPSQLRGKKAAKKVPLPKTMSTWLVTYEYEMQSLWPGEVYQFIVAAENRCGLGEFSPFSDYVKMESTAPDAPEPPIVTSVGKRRIDISWVKPRSNGSEILQYIIEWSESLDPLTADPETHAVTLLTKSILGTTYTISGLRPGRCIQVRVAATNLVNGKLAASPFSGRSEIKKTLCDVPDKPDQPQLISPTSHSITVSVVPPCDNGVEILRFQIALFSEQMQFGIVTKQLVREVDLETSQLDVIEKDLQYTFSQLRAKTFYSTTAVAVNALGSSARSDSSSAVATKPPTVPSPITDLPIVRDIEPTRATLSWIAPEHDGGAIIASFVLQYSVNDSPFEHEIVLFRGFELVLEHLKPKTRYQFRVAANNAVGRAVFSPVCEAFVTPSLVEFTITTYFASRPEIEHVKARAIQRFYRLRKLRARKHAAFIQQLTRILASSWHIL